MSEKKETKKLIAMRKRCQIKGDFGTRWIDDNIVIDIGTSREGFKGFMLVYNYFMEN